MVNHKIIRITIEILLNTYFRGNGGNGYFGNNA